MRVGDSPARLAKIAAKAVPCKGWVSLRERAAGSKTSPPFADSTGAKPPARLANQKKGKMRGCRSYKTLYTPGMSIRQPIEFRGSSLEDFRAFPLATKREAGHQLDLVQIGQEPDDWKSMNTVGQGVREIRIRDSSGIFRVVYVAKFSDAIYILHVSKRSLKRQAKQT